MENENNEDWVEKFLTIAVILSIITFIYGFIYKLIEYLFPEDSIKKSKFAIHSITTGIVMLGFFVIDAIMEPSSHPSLAYSPQQYREMMKKKCMFEIPMFHNLDSNISTYCVALDAPDLPVNLQGGYTVYPNSPSNFFDENNINYSMGTVKEVNYYSDNRQKFSHPAMKYIDGSMPGNSPLRFWETKKNDQ